MSTPANFHVIDGLDGRILRIESARIDDCMRFFHDEKMDGIHITSLVGDYVAGDVEFLKDHPDINSVLVSEGTGINLDRLRHVTGVKRLCLSNYDNPVPLSSFSKLQTFAGDWSPGLDLGSDCRQLQTLTLHKFKGKDLSEFPMIPSLSVLELIQPTIASLTGIERHPHIEKLQFERCAKLSSIKPIEGLNDGALYDLVFSRCRRIANMEALGNMPKIKRLILEFCGSLTSLDFLSGCTQLEVFGFFETNILSGDLSPLLKLLNLTFAGTGNKRHYSHTDVQLNQLLKDKLCESD